MRHFAVADLWVQDKVNSCDFQLVKVAGAENPTDLLTKRVEYPVMMKHLAFLGLSAEDGRAESAPTLTH